MAQQRATILDNAAICAALKQAWEDSQPGVTGGHEEGGFILRSPEGDLSVVRWLKGAQNSIILPVHSNCKIGERDIVATFHTHPNTGSDYLQEPSKTDKRAVRNDPDLKGELYEGEYVLSEATIYHITPTGQVEEVGATRSIFDNV